MQQSVTRLGTVPFAGDIDPDIYRRLVESVPGYAIFVLDPHGHVRSWNPAAQRIKGYRAEDIIGRHFSVFYPKDAVASGRPERDLVEARAAGRFEDEGWRVRSDGSRFWASVSLAQLLGDDGELIGFATVARDLTVRHGQEEALRRSEERFRLMVESVRDYAIFMLDPQGHVASWNLGAQETKGYSAAEIIGRHFSVFYPDDVVARGWPAHELAMARVVGRFEDEGWRVRKDGSRFWASVVITRLLDDRGEVVGFGKVTRDLTARRAQEEALRRSEERFRLLVESVRDHAMFMLDPEGRVASWNAGAQATQGYAAEEIIGQHFSAFYTPEAVASGWPPRELERAVREGRVEDEGWRVRKDGSRFWASVMIAPLFGDDGRHLGFAKITRDLTEQRRVRVLEDEGRRMTTFLAMLGHELRNPLAPIANAVSILRLVDSGSEQVRMCRDVIARQVKQLTRLVDDLLDMGRISAGKIQLERRPVELGPVLREAIEAVDPMARARAHAVTATFAEAPVWVRGDRARLLQVFQNLLNNAIKFTPPGGRIHAELGADDMRARVVVRDNGPGIPAHRSSDIFNLFVQGDAQASSQGGLGLGLSLVQQLVTLHGGDVGVFSTGQPGEGAEFIVRLDRIGAPALHEPAAPPMRSFEPRSFLVVDDNRDAADTLAQLLRHLGHRAEVRYGGRDAVGAVQALRPDAVFLDIGMPDVDGVEVARQIVAAVQPAPALIALTGYGQDAHRQAALDAGFDLHLSKPLAGRELQDVLGRLFG